MLLVLIVTHVNEHVQIKIDGLIFFIEMRIIVKAQKYAWIQLVEMFFF